LGFNYPSFGVCHPSPSSGVSSLLASGHALALALGGRGLGVHWPRARRGLVRHARSPTGRPIPHPDPLLHALSGGQAETSGEHGGGQGVWAVFRAFRRAAGGIRRRRWHRPAWLMAPTSAERAHRYRKQRNGRSQGHRYECAYTTLGQLRLSNRVAFAVANPLRMPRLCRPNVLVQSSSRASHALTPC
jgi:hypothetical protein